MNFFQGFSVAIYKPDKKWLCLPVQPVFGMMGFQDPGCQHGCQRKGNKGRNQDGSGNNKGELTK